MRDFPQIIDYDKDQLAYALANALKERDEARELLASEKITRDHIIQRGIEMQKERDEAREYGVRMEAIWNSEVQRRFRDVDGLQAKINVLTKEREEARDQVKELIYIAGRAIELAEIDFENDKFGVVSELRDGLQKIKEETK